MSYREAIIALAMHQVVSLGAFTFGQQYLESSAPKVKWDKVNNRSKSNQTAYEKAVPRHVYLRWERAMATSANMNENFAFVVGAFLVAFISGLDPSTVNSTMVYYLISRIGYAIVYISFAGPPLGYLRPVFWWIGMILLSSLYWKSAMASKS